jgi:hypothetical protein
MPSVRFSLTRPIRPAAPGTQALTFVMGGHGVVLLELAEARLGSAEDMRGHGGPPASRVDAELGPGRAQPDRPHPGVVFPRLGP